MRPGALTRIVGTCVVIGVFATPAEEYKPNPVLARALDRILIHRVYCLALAGLFLAVAHLCFQRKSTKGLIVNGRLGAKALTVLLTLVSLSIAIATGMFLGGK